MTQSLSTGHLDYLLRSFLDGAVPDHRGGPGSWAREDFRRLSRIRAVGRLDRHRHREPPRPGPAEPPPAPATRDLLTGAHAYRISVAFLACGSPGEIQLHLGTWEPTLAADQPAPADVLDARQAVLTTLLDTLYPVVRHQPTGTRVPALPQVGLAVGVPSYRPPDPLDPANPWDRLARALSGLSWAVLVLAQPVAPEAARRVRDLVLNELRVARSEADALRAPSPLADYYATMLKGQSDALLEAEASGAWRTGAYLLGDAASYPRLAAAWVAQFNGEQSRPEPVRVQYGEQGVSPQFTASWALPEPPVPPGPGAFQHPFAYQTLLSSRQLAGYVHLPEREAPGFEVFSVPGFDQVPPTPAGDGRQVTLGQVVRHDRPTTTGYPVPHRSLLRHTFVAGVTGSGKTTTLLGLLDQAYAGGVPFLVIEPAKTEYRQLLRHPRLGRIVQVFTAGQEQVSPLRLNPFEVVGQTPVSVHLDLLRSLFTASFGMWAPLPQLLEQAMHRIYRAAGWDVTGSQNPRLDPTDDPAAAYPTMSELVVEAERVIAEQDWEGQIGSNLRASLVTRLAGLCQGGKGAMLDTRRSVPPGLLFNHPTVLELEAVGDDDDKAFLIGLLLIRLVEYRRDQPPPAPEQLRHLLVIEEAHRLLSNVARRGGEGVNDSRAKAVETFANLLAEIRGYGQGVVVADQVPVKLAPDVIKNTTLKVAHRVVDAEDRRVLAGAMAMTDPQAASLAILPTGRAAVFSDGDDAPLLVQLPPLSGMDRPDDLEVAAAMAGRPLRLEFADLFRPHPGCRDESGRDCELARRLVEQDPTVRRSVSRLALALAVLEPDDEPAGYRHRAGQLWDGLWQRTRQHWRPGRDEAVLAGCLATRAADWWCARRGAGLGWTYRMTEALSEQLAAALATLGSGGDVVAGAAGYRRAVTVQHEREVDPLPRCADVCPGRQCLYRLDAAELVDSGELLPGWQRAREADRDGPPTHQWTEGIRAAWALAGPEPTAAVTRRAGLCAAQQVTIRLAGNYPETAAARLDALVAAAAGHGDLGTGEEGQR